MTVWSGYGHVTPLSTEGKIFCVIYAAVGIPLTLIMLKAVAEAVMVPLGDAMAAMERRLKAASCCSLACRLLPVLSVVALLVSFIFIVPAAVFCSLEPEWSFLDAFYFCFISIATVGLGDYIPGSSPNQQPAAFYKACTVGKSWPWPLGLNRMTVALVHCILIVRFTFDIVSPTKSLKA